jgi:hypothetical protein
MTTATPYGRRDRIAAAICNWTLRHIASERYRKMIGGSIGYGLASAARDDTEKREPPWPPPWFSSIRKDEPGVTPGPSVQHQSSPVPPAAPGAGQLPASPGPPPVPPGT